jgi:hypothetical protein
MLTNEKAAGAGTPTAQEINTPDNNITPKAVTAKLRTTLRLDNIPPELKAHKAWLAWRIPHIAPLTGKIQKVPVYPRSGVLRNGMQGAPDDLANLGTFEDAVSRFNSDKSIAGVGFALLPQWGIVALDVDHCVTDGVVREDAAELTQFTYAELSPSGTGIRAFWRGSAANGKNNNTGFELFHENSFVTLTGHRLDNMHQAFFGDDLPELGPGDRTRLETLSRASGKSVSVPAKLKEAAENDPRLRAIIDAGLYERDMGGGKHSIQCPFEHEHSDYGRGAGDGDTVYLQPHTNGYAEGHIHCSHTHGNSQAAYWAELGYGPTFDADHSAYKLWSPAELAALPPMKWLVRNIIPATGIGVIYGASRSGKTFLLLDLMAAISTGRLWFGYEIKESLPCTYVALEGRSGVPKRIAACLSKWPGLDIATVIESWDIRDPGDRSALAQAIKDAGRAGGVLAIDTLAQSAPGMDENSSQDMTLLVKACQKLQEDLGGVVLLIHHTGKDAGKGMRGSSALLPALDASIEVKRNLEARSWLSDKVKDGPDGVEHAFTLSTVHLGVDDDGEAITSVIIAEGQSGARVRARPTGAHQRVVFDGIAELAATVDQGEAPDNVPFDRNAVPLETLVAGLRGRLSCEPDRQTERIRQAVTGLQNNGFVLIQDGWLWIA